MYTLYCLMAVHSFVSVIFNDIYTNYFRYTGNTYVETVSFY